MSTDDHEDTASPAQAERRPGPGRGHTVVVGAGLAGLSAALHLAAAGRDVTVVEATGEPGGRAGSARVGPYRFDTGPSVLTMPDLLAETFGAAGEELDEWLPLRALDPVYRIGFHDGEHLDILPDETRMVDEVRRVAGDAEAARYRRFRAHLTTMYEAEWDTFIARDFPTLGSMARPVALAKLARLGGFRRLNSLVASHLHNWRVQRAHTFQSLYVGISPFDALGIYAVIAYMDTMRGAWFPKQGGMHAVATALAAVAEKAGAQFRYHARVERVEADASGVTGVRLAGGEVLPAGDVIVTSDIVQAYEHLVPEGARDWRVQKRRPNFAPSCYLVHLGLPRELPDQAHHTLHLGEDWKGTFDALTKQGQIQPDPSLLVTHPSPGDPDAAPDGHSTLFVLEPTANTHAGHDWDEVGPRLRTRLFERLEKLGYGDLEGDAEAELTVDPPAWEADGLTAGTPFSLDHRFTQTGWFRPGMASNIPGLTFAGMGTVPGVGVPMVIVSGRLAAERVTEGRSR